jgi:hypothetical protein
VPLHETYVLLGGIAAVAALSACNLDQRGIEPAPATLNFPMALALSAPAAPGEASSRLFVVNSNFDLRFNDGTLMALDLERLAGSGAAGDRGLLGAEECSAEDPCEFDDLTELVSSEVGIGSHTDAVSLSPDGARLYLASRANRNLTFVDWNEEQSRFDCDQTADRGPLERCADAFRHADEAEVATERSIVLDGDPVAVATGPLEELGAGEGAGDYVLLALRDGRVALIIDDAAHDGAPELVDILEGLPNSLLSMAVQPGAGIAWVTSAASNQLARVGVVVDPDEPNRSFLYDAGALRLGGVDDGQDARDIKFDPALPDERAFVLARRPESVITLDLARPGVGAGDVGLGEIFEVGAGPSRLAVARLAGRTFVVASAFDARRLFVIDVDHGALVGVVGGFSGPFEMVVDEARQLLFVADFSVSVVRVLDLEPLARSAPPRLLATLGDPTPVERFAN